MEKKVAIPVENGMLCAHFGHCEKFYIAVIEGDKIKNELEIIPPEHQPGLYPKWIKAQGVACVIAGGMVRKAKTPTANRGSLIKNATADITRTILVRKWTSESKSIR